MMSVTKNETARREDTDSVADDLLTELFSSRVRAAVLRYLLPRPHLGFSLTELSRALDLPISSLQHECYKLARLGVLTVNRVGAARMYQPNPEFPLLPPLTTLVIRAVGTEVALTAALDGMPALDLALFSTPFANHVAEQALGCLVLVGELTLEQVDAAYGRVRAMIESGSGAAELELAYFRPGDWALRRGNHDSLVTDLLAAPHLVLTGTTDTPAPEA